MKHPSDKIPLRKALFYIFSSVLIVCGTALGLVAYSKSIIRGRQYDPNYEIVSIVQTCSQKDCLPTDYLAELLHLSIDEPTNLYSFNTRLAQENLLESPLIETAKVKKLPPGTIHVEYTLRVPIATLADYSNTVIDRKGVLFPRIPFYEIDSLPEIVLGKEQNLIGNTESPWGETLSGECFQLACGLLQRIQQQCCQTELTAITLDLSRINASSYGQRQLIIQFKDDIKIWTVRLPADEIEAQLDNFLALRENIFKTKNEKFRNKPHIILDMRLKDLAYISVE